MNTQPLTMRRIKNAVYDIVGAYDGRYAYKGPRWVQIDLTNRCNNNCIGCWCNSPLLEERKLPEQISNATLDMQRVKLLLNELWDMGTEEIYFAGGGEPFMHPEAMKIFAYAKRKGFHVSINTNFTLVNRDVAQCLVDNGVDHLVISVWAGTPAVYAQTHPNQSEDTFHKIKDVLSFLNEYKGRKGKAPTIKVYNVLFNMNCHEFETMIDFVITTGSESVEFTLIDTIPDKTDSLLLSDDQATYLFQRASYMQEIYATDHPVYLANYDTFLKRLSSRTQKNGEYDRAMVEDVPCYAGWTFARIIANGDVNSCLKSHRIPIGNINNGSFREIWNNRKQQEFRCHTRNINPDNPYFRFIGNDINAVVGCYRSCDNIGHSMLMKHRIDRLTFPEKVVFKSIARVGHMFHRVCSRVKKD